MAPVVRAGSLRCFAGSALNHEARRLRSLVLIFQLVWPRPTIRATHQLVAVFFFSFCAGLFGPLGGYFLTTFASKAAFVPSRPHHRPAFGCINFRSSAADTHFQPQQLRTLRISVHFTALFAIYKILHNFTHFICLGFLVRSCIGGMHVQRFFPASSSQFGSILFHENIFCTAQMFL
jgi:hypothetical protein